MKRKTVVVGVTGGIAAFKTCQLVSDLGKMNYDVHVIMTKNACEFIAPLTFETLSHNRVSVDTFEKNYLYDVNHISLAKKCDVFIIAPCSANVIGKIANGICDDMLTTTFMASTCPKIICPAMNTAMLENIIVQDNIDRLKKYGIQIVESISGLLACLDVGKGKLADNDVIIESINDAMINDKYLKGKNILITAGATVEKIDPVRYISNHSTGKMGVAIATCAKRLGANVTLICNTNEKVDPNIKRIDVKSANEMYENVKKEFDKCDYLIMAAAVADYTIKNISINKLKKNDDDLTLKLSRTIDILKYCGENKKHQKIIGFAMESENLIENAKNKLNKKNCDLIVANNINDKGAGFATNTNLVTFVGKDEVISHDLMSKIDVGYKIFEYIKEKE